MLHVNIIHMDEERNLAKEMAELTSEPLMFTDILMEEDVPLEDITTNNEQQNVQGGDDFGLSIDDIVGDEPIITYGTSLREEQEEEMPMTTGFTIDNMINDIIEPPEQSTGSAISNSIIGGQITKHRGRSKSENEFKKEFADEITLLYDSIKDLEELEKQIRTAMGINDGRRKIRGVSKNINDGFTNIVTLRKQRTDIITTITRIKKDIIDLELKHRKASADSGEVDQNALLAGSSIIQQIFENGRGALVDAIKTPERQADDLMSTVLSDQGDNDGDDIQYDTMRRIKHNTYNDDEKDALVNKMDERLQNEKSSRSKEGDLNIYYEKLQPQIKVRRFKDTDEYEFFAVDKEGNLIPDYPLPDPDKIGQIKFSGRLAVDRRGVQYIVEDAYSDEDDEDSDDMYN